MIDTLEQTKATAAGKAKWRFKVLMDCCGYTVGTPGWIYLPEAKKGFRVWPPKRGHVKTITGVKQPLTHLLEEMVEKKLEARGCVSEFDEVDLSQKLLKGEI